MGTSKVKLQNHNSRDHALLSASGSERWLNCTPSAKLEDEFGERKTSIFANEGTLAHELGEIYLRRDSTCEISDEEFDSKLEEIMSNELFNEEMLDMVPIYTDYCIDQFNEAKTKNSLATSIVEAKLDLTEYIPESFGTSDYTIINDDTMEVIDLKYGKGVPVYATMNKQLMLYGLGALRQFDTMYDIKTVKLTIVQPRINNISSWSISVSELKEWAETELKEKAKMAFEGTGELNAGSWCKFCSVANKCRQLHDENLKLAKYDFADAKFLSDDEIADILKRTPSLIEWANSIVEYAKDKTLTENKQWPGYKLVAGQSRRKWLNEDAVASAIFTRMPEISDDDIYNMKLKPITEIEKIVGKKRFAEELSDVVIKPDGKPTLVPIEDKRPALGVSQAKLDFQ